MLDEQNQYDLAKEQAVLQEWNYLQQSLFRLFSTKKVTASSKRCFLADTISHLTRKQASICWDETPDDHLIPQGYCYEIKYGQIHYDWLELAPNYLVSNLLPDIPQQFANVCALLLYLAEHEKFVNYHLSQIPPLHPRRSGFQLTKREQEVLQGLMRGESREEMAQRLGVEKTTIHSHIQRLYNRLDVHSAQEAIVRAFVWRLVDWLDMP
ncbi:MAG TPA: helix-turn-helix transcriptional regulator [Ktedonobacteraceae bacterium]|jgi:DNA-binding CsgD family transcriptional regulator|nr:helix-turn-helix transcriptional regulator [Ktedonobacteraceae bacterium]